MKTRKFFFRLVQSEKPKVNKLHFVCAQINYRWVLQQVEKFPTVNPFIPWQVFFYFKNACPFSYHRRRRKQSTTSTIMVKVYPRPSIIFYLFIIEWKNATQNENMMNDDNEKSLTSCPKEIPFVIEMKEIHQINVSSNIHWLILTREIFISFLFYCEIFQNIKWGEWANKKQKFFLHITKMCAHNSSINKYKNVRKV